MSSTVLMEPRLPGSLDPATASAKGEHVFNAVNRIMEEQLKSWLDVAKGAKTDAASEAIKAWRDTAKEFAVSRDQDKFHVAKEGDAMNSSRYSRMKSELEAAANEMAAGVPAGMSRGYTTFNRRLNDMVLVDVTAPAYVRSGANHSVDYTAADTVKASLKSNEKPTFDAWFESTAGLMYLVVLRLRDAALAVGRARAGA
jgi:hypothetical protein